VTLDDAPVPWRQHADGGVRIELPRAGVLRVSS
jgi:hypothetical protein